MGLLALLSGLAVAGPAGADISTGAPGFAASFNLRASNGYSIDVSAYGEGAGGKGTISLFVHRKDESAGYSAPAAVTATTVDADLGPLGRIDVVLHPSGLQKVGTLPLRRAA